jgi:hypothetical protein
MCSTKPFKATSGDSCYTTGEFIFPIVEEEEEEEEEDNMEQPLEQNHSGTGFTGSTKLY